MPTKAELEAELKELKQLLAEAKAAKSGNGSSKGGDDPHEHTGHGPIDWAMSQVDGSEIEKLFGRFADEVKDMSEHKPLLTVFGAFVLGYVLGRGR